LAETLPGYEISNIETINPKQITNSKFKIQSLKPENPRIGDEGFIRPGLSKKRRKARPLLREGDEGL